MENVEVAALPPGWAWAQLGDLITGIEAGLNVAAIGRAPVTGETGIVKISAVTWGEFNEEQSKTLPATMTIDPRYLIAAGDFLISRANTLELVGAPVIVKKIERRLVLSDKVLRLRFRHGLDRWIELYLKSAAGRAQIESRAQGAQLSMRNISQQNLRRIMVPTAPDAERARILEMVDRSLAEVDEADAAIKRVRGQMKDYRASLLHAACTGALTADWRATNPCPPEDGSALLRRILAERRAAWEQTELAQLTAAGKVPRGEAWKRRYPEPVAIDSEPLDPLPSTWTWASLDQLTSVITSGSRAWSPYYGRGTGTFIMAQNVRLGRFNPFPRQPVDPPFNDSERKRTAVERDDVLVTIVGANTGDACRINSNLVESYVCQSVGLLRPVNAGISAFMEAYLIAPSGGQATFKQMMYGAGRPHLSFDQLRSTPIPLPPPYEQSQIVVEIRDHAIDAPSEETGAVQVRDELADLRQSILHAAFSGRLVPQDPADEPAATLLARLRTEAAPSTPRRTTRTKAARP